MERSIVAGGVLVAALTVLSGCANTTAEERWDGITVHTLRLSYNNTFVVQQGERALLIDSGLERDAAALEEALRGVGVDPAALGGILLTHGHADHAGGARRFQQRWGVPVVAGAGDASLLARGENDPLCPTSDRARDRLEADQRERFTPLQADRLLEEDLPLEELGGPPGRVLLLPGHTEGSLVVVLGEVAFVGDLLRGAIVGSSAEAHFYMCDLEDNRSKIQRLLRAHPDVKRFYTGHFGPVSREAVTAYLERAASP